MAPPPTACRHAPACRGRRRRRDERQPPSPPTGCSTRCAHDGICKSIANGCRDYGAKGGRDRSRKRPWRSGCHQMKSPSGLWRNGVIWGGFLALVANTSPHHAAALPLRPSFVQRAGQHARHQHISQRASFRSGDRPLERIKHSPSTAHRNVIARRASSSSEEFPQLDHHDPEDEWDEWGSASVGFDRRKYSQLGATPSGRRGMTINTDGDEWEGYEDTNSGLGSDDTAEGGFDDFSSLDVSKSTDTANSDQQAINRETRNIDNREDDRGSDSTSSGIDRGNYQRLGAVPGGRRGIIMSSDEDEWEGYHSMEPGSDSGEDDFGSLDVSNGIGGKEKEQSLPVNKEERHDNAHNRAPKQETESARNAPSSNTPKRADGREAVSGTDRLWVRANNARLANDADGGAHVTYNPNEERAVHLEGEPSVDNFRSQFVAAEKVSDDASANKSVDAQQPKSTRRRIPPEEIEHIKSTISIVDAIESYDLDEFTRTSSRGAKACCPFHDDTNPSMSIDDDRGLYKCFACGAGGDVFNFVREYDYLDKRKGEEKMNYMTAVEYAAREFGDDALVKDWNFANGGGGTFEGLSEEAIEKIRERERKRGRIKEANTAAAAFYTRCLVTLPTAGKARAHLRSRSISPASIRSFSLGYAPDCYYGDEARGSEGKKKWGEGSLVEYLAEEGFTPDEIVEAGLATRTKRISPQGGDATGKEDNEELDYSGLMDRFRSRLIVPIMDEGGRDVIALGGRHLEAAIKEDDDTGDREELSSFAPAKYINSPDSLAFTKKNVLFNRYGAKLAMEEEPDEDAAASSDEAMVYDAPPAVIIVEGYFDAIALSNVGVRNVVASMGTALPVEQLEIVAKMENVPGGRIVLCMDGDDAGQNAVERICRNDILSKVPDLNRNELYVATLPGGEVKDPSDFIDFAGGGEKAGKRFQDEVLENAVPWDEWFVDRILSRHTEDEGDDGGSFSNVCEELSTFLSTFPNPADRTRRAHKAAETLAGLIIARDESNSDSSSSIAMLRVQLESDILNMSSRKAGVREAMERRIEQTDGVSGGATAGRMERLTSGGDATRDDDDRKMPKSSLARDGRPHVSRERVQVARANARATPRPVGAPTNSRRSFRATRNRQRPPEQDLAPHFNGFTFKHESDRDWLGLSRNGKTKPKMHLGETPSTVEERNRLRAETPMFEEDHVVPRRKKQDPVYFNSNGYLGQQYLSPEAVRAGYELGSDRPSSGESIVEFTERRMFEGVDPEQHILQAESRLLHALAKFPQARATMRTVYSTSVFGPSNMRWTSEEREWLFLCLTGSPEIDPPLPAELLDGGTSSQLHAFLANREDCPHDAFTLDLSDDAIDKTNAAHQQAVIDASVEPSSDPDEHSAGIAGDSSSLGSTGIEVEVVGADDGNELDSFPESSPAQASTFDDKEDAGLLDEYFLEADDMFPAFSNSKIARETRAELTVQETVATLLRATAKKRFSSAKAKLAVIVSEMDRRDQDEAQGDKDVRANPDFEGVSEDELQDMFCEAGEEVVDAQKSLYESERSSDRVNSHLLDYSVSNGVLYRQGQAELERLDKMMDEYVSSLPEDHHRPETPGNDGTYVFGSDEFDDSGIDPMFGGTNPDDYVVRGLPDGESKFE